MIIDGWYCCPHCGWNRVQPIDDKSTISGTDIYCKKCKGHSFPTIINGKEYAPVAEQASNK